VSSTITRDTPDIALRLNAIDDSRKKKRLLMEAAIANRDIRGFDDSDGDRLLHVFQVSDRAAVSRRARNAGAIRPFGSGLIGWRVARAVPDLVKVR
jgi:hypothetical protein